MTTSLIEKVKISFIGFLNSENNYQENGGTKCANYMSFQFRLIITFIGVR